MPEPSLRITRGSLTDEELAALTAVLMARAAAVAAPEPEARVIRLPRLSARRPAYHSPVSWMQAA
ncbi:acyl-CoA carboxylase epsilon subunit [Kitasatospora sp. NPDC058965]|uniref:acyl-CoA carboxylase epsilon subunit n=1 Tax=Kitasatospora sp. NPDC058965 TaxID=3346682 RepID=UPI00368D0AAE